jgi:hypothetical protein
MTDRDTLIAMLTRAEIPYEEGVGPEDHTGITLTVTRDSDTIIGYTGFMTTIHFDGDGNLLKIGVWE